MRKALPLAAWLLVVTIAVNAMLRISEKKVGGGVKFAVNQDHTLRPMMGVDLDVVQEAGPMTDGSMSCDVLDRIHDVTDESQHKIAHETILHCDGGRVFAIRKLWFR